MGRVKTFTNGGSLLAGDLNSIEDDYEFAFSTYKQTVLDASCFVASGFGGSGNVYGLWENAGQITNTTVTNPPQGANAYPLYLDPADWTANTRTTKLRVRAMAYTQNTASTITFTVGLYPITGVTAGNYTVGTVVTGSTVAFASPTASSANQANSGDFTSPAAGFYTLGIAFSATPNTGARVHAVLQVRQV